MPELSRNQIALYAVLVVVIAFVGARALSASPAPDSAAEAATGAATSASAGARTDAARTTSTPAAAAAPETGSPATPGGSSTARVMVHVAGAVRRPGVYTLSAQARVLDAVHRAGGPSRHGEANAINLAAKLTDGEEILVPKRGTGSGGVSEPAAGGLSSPGDAASPAIVDLNTATEVELETIDGVGPATAQKILDYRTAHGGFRTVDDLLAIPGIGDKKLAAMRPHVRI